MSRDLLFKASDDLKELFLKTKKKGSGYKIDKTDNSIMLRSPAIWLTNLDHKKRHDLLELNAEFSKEKYPKYDNYDAINVDKTKDIPKDYKGVMGVPISFLDKYCPEQFEIVALGNSRDNFTPTKDYINPKKHLKNGSVVNGGAINCVLALETDKLPFNQIYYTSENSKYLLPPYARIIIKNKFPKKDKK